MTHMYFSARAEGRISYGHLGRTNSCFKSNEYSVTTNNYNDKVKMILRSRLKANINYVVTTLYSALKMGIL